MSVWKTICFVLIASVFLGSVLVPLSANSSDTISDGEKKNNKNISDYSGEKLIFDISFLWFTNAAEGSMLLEKNGNEYIANLKAETKGFVGFFTGYIKHLYVSHMKVVGKKKGLQPYLFEKNVNFRRKKEKVITTLDYKTRTMPWYKTIN